MIHTPGQENVIPRGYQPLSPSEYAAAHKSLRVAASFYLRRERDHLDRLKQQMRNRILVLDGEAARLRGQCDELWAIVRRLRLQKARLERAQHELELSMLVQALGDVAELGTDERRHGLATGLSAPPAADYPRSA